MRERKSGVSMNKLNGSKKLLTILLSIVLFIQPVLAEAAIEFEIQLPKESYGLSFTEFDVFKCYKGRAYANEDLSDPPYFNRDNYKNLSIFLREELDDLVRDDNYDFVNYTIYGGSEEPDIMLDIFDDKGNVYSFRTEGGYWWALSRDIEGFDVFNSSSLEQISTEYSRTHDNFRPIIRSIEWAVAQIVPGDPMTGGFCEMEPLEGEQSLLELVNIYLSNTYFDEVGCEYSEGGIYADCSDSKLYQSIKKGHDFWEFKDSESQITYKSRFAFIFLDKSDIRFIEGEKRANNLGFMVVISQADIFEGFGSGQSIFVGDDGHLGYLRALDDIYRNTQEIKSLNEVLNEKIIELSTKKQELNDIFRDSDDDLESKNDKLQDLPDSNITSFINENRHVLVSYETFYDEKSALRNSIKDTYFGLYYQEISQDYFEDLNLEIKNLKSNLEYLERRNDVYTESHVNLLVSIQSQIDSLKNQKFSNRSLIATLLFAIIVLFVTLSMNVLVDISNKYSQRIMEIARKKIQGVLFFTFIIVILLLVSTEYLGGLELLVGITAYILILVIAGFRSITGLLDYDRVLKIIKKEDIKYINKIEVSSGKSDENDLMSQVLDESILEDIKFKLKFSLENIEEMYFLEIFDILYKSVENNNTIHTKKGLDTLIEIVESYVDSRKYRRIAEDGFIEYIYQKLVALANISINKENVFITNDIIKAIESVGSKTVEFEPISLQLIDNAPLGAIYHLGDLGVRSSEKLPDSVKQSLISIGNIGKLGAIRWQRSSIASDTIGKILSYNPDWFVYYHGVSALVSIINEEAKNHVNEIQVSMEFEKLTKICSSAFDLKFASNSLMGPLFGIGEVSLHKIVENIIGLIKVEFPEIETHGREKYVKSVLKEIIDLFRKVKAKSFETNDYRLSPFMNKEIEKIIDILSKEKLETYPKNFSNEIKELEKAKIVKYPE